MKKKASKRGTHIRLSGWDYTFHFLNYLLFGVFTGILGLVENLRHPSLDWSNEAQAVKTGVGLLFTMLISWATLIPPIILYAVCDVNFNICAWGFAAAIAAADILLYRWLMSRGAEIYAAL